MSLGPLGKLSLRKVVTPGLDLFQRLPKPGDEPGMICFSFIYFSAAAAAAVPQRTRPLRLPFWSDVVFEAVLVRKILNVGVFLFYGDGGGILSPLSSFRQDSCSVVAESMKAKVDQIFNLST